MNLTVRRVPLGWEAPVDKDGKYKSQIDDSFSYHLAHYEERKKKWAQGLKELEFSYNGVSKFDWGPIPPEDWGKTFEEIHSGPPIAEMYRPDWCREFCICYQLYYGDRTHTPLSPVCKSAIQLAEWCLDAVEDGKITYEDFVMFCCPHSFGFCSIHELVELINYKSTHGIHYKHLPALILN